MAPTAPAWFGTHPEVAQQGSRTSRQGSSSAASTSVFCVLAHDDSIRLLLNPDGTLTGVRLEVLQGVSGPSVVTMFMRVHQAGLDFLATGALPESSAITVTATSDDTTTENLHPIALDAPTQPSAVSEQIRSSSTGLRGFRCLTEDISRGAEQMSGVSEHLGSMSKSLYSLSPAVHGMLISNPAELTEPRPTDNNIGFLDVLHQFTDDIVDRMCQTAADHTRVETRNTRTSRKIRGLIDNQRRGLHP